MERGARTALRAYPVSRAARAPARRAGRLDRGIPERPRARVRRGAARGAERRGARGGSRDDRRRHTGRADDRGKHERRAGARSQSGPAAMSARAKLRLGTRGSDLARTQSTTVAEALRAAGHDVELTIIKTAGDRDQTRAFGSIGPQGVFVREIEQALV